MILNNEICGFMDYRVSGIEHCNKMYSIVDEELIISILKSNQNFCKIYCPENDIWIARLSNRYCYGGTFYEKLF